MLLDKDFGEIMAVLQAWSQAKIQLCLQHVERAIERKLKENKSQKSQYLAQKAHEASLEFGFISPTWLSEEPQSKICSKESIKELIGLIKRHALLHPLIPICKNIFLTSKEIRYQSVLEVYQFCHQKNLVDLQGYLWINWYNIKNWNLFA